MNRLTRTLALFGTACVITGLVKWIGRPQDSLQPLVEINPPVPQPVSWTKDRLMDLIERLESATTDSERLVAAVRFSEIPVSKLPEALELTPLVKDHRLTLAAKVLLIHWAASDGNGASRWAWVRFRAEGLWESAFSEIGPSWASRQPKSLEKWAIAHHNSSHESISLQDGMASDKPILNFETLDDVSRWLVREDPQAAFKVLQARGGFSTRDNLAEALQSVDEVRHALLAFDHLDQMVPDRFNDSEISAHSLFVRWRELDPESLLRSPYARFGVAPGGHAASAAPDTDLASALALADTMPPPQRQAAWVRTFHSWTKANPEKVPDQAGWSIARIQAWEDLEAIRP